MEFILIFCVTLFATFLSAMSGGGASTINLPVFLMLGIPFPLATSIQKCSSACWVIPAGYNYLKGRKVDWLFVCLFSLLGLIGVAFAVMLMLSINEVILKRIVGALILIFVLHTYLRKDLGLGEKHETTKMQHLLSYPMGLILGFYEGIFGAGNAIAFCIFTMYVRGYDLIKAMGHYYAVSFLWTLMTAVFLAYRGVFDLYLTIPAIVGGVLGGYLGSKLAVYKGNAFVKNAFVIIGGLLGLRLLIG